ncbi:hypothetical protein JZ751_011424 [Albula glossodonta]|uniref:Protein SSUH2 homolog n=1 Tax=Albula glossodonta TaxID=121402 RepID=A0A8T2MMC9_9TELE|nr:hypothetical protein JZ751_011424 [Albula glossodonta]
MDDKYEDLGDFNPAIEEEGPTAPPPGWLENVTGYEEMHEDQDGTDKLYPPPPAYVPVPDNGRSSSVPNVRVPVVSEDVAREALLQFVGKKWTYSSKPAHNMIFKDLKPFTVYRARCSSCYGKGRKGKKRCITCSGTGKKRCWRCSGKGYKTCPSCQGHQNLMHFIQLSIKWKNEAFEFIPDRYPEFPVKKFKKVSGDQFFVDESILVYPIVGFPDQDICDMSRKMSEEHLVKFSSVSRILQQRQSIELVPLTHAFYTYNGKDFNYFIYGIENKVYSPKYPSSCSIL